MSLTIITGTMCGGKTAELLKRYRTACQALEGAPLLSKLKPVLLVADPRIAKGIPPSPGRILERTTRTSEPCTLFGADDSDTFRQLLEESGEVPVYLDEAQFLAPDACMFLGQIASQGREVVLCGLTEDYLGRPFGPLMDLMNPHQCPVEYTLIHRLQGRCIVCDQIATRIFRKPQAGGATIVVGREESYEARCQTHWLEGIALYDGEMRQLAIEADVLKTE